jgi:Small primase-like proteins (Toprim domain)
VNDEQRLEMLNGVIEELHLLAVDHIIIVEGIKDKKALMSLGLEAAFSMVQQEGGPIRIAESIYERKRKAVILTDWDDKGNIIAAELKRNLSALCVPFDMSVRSRLKDICVKDIKDIESIDSLYERLSKNEDCR